METLSWFSPFQSLFLLALENNVVIYERAMTTQWVEAAGLGSCSEFTPISHQTKVRNLMRKVGKVYQIPS